MSDDNQTPDDEYEDRLTAFLADADDPTDAARRWALARTWPSTPAASDLRVASLCMLLATLLGHMSEHAEALDEPPERVFAGWCNAFLAIGVSLSDLLLAIDSLGMGAAAQESSG